MVGGHCVVAVTTATAFVLDIHTKAPVVRVTRAHTGRGTHRSGYLGYRWRGSSRLTGWRRRDTGGTSWGRAEGFQAHRAGPCNIATSIFEPRHIMFNIFDCCAGKLRELLLCSCKFRSKTTHLLHLGPHFNRHFF